MEEILETGSEGGPLADCAGQVVACVWSTTRIGIGKVIVECAADPVVAESLGQFDDANQEGSRREIYGAVSADNGQNLDMMLNTL